MDQFVWKEIFNIGITDIDQQHREFMDLLNNFEQKSSIKKESEIKQSIIDQLKLYAAKHFRTEESFMQKINYPELEKQRQMHKYFETQVSEIASSQGKISPDSMITFMRDWFINHIMEEDIKFAQYGRRW
jgi:hemerythrin-like metal-binding protein